MGPPCRKGETAVKTAQKTPPEARRSGICASLADKKEIRVYALPENVV